MSEKTYTLELTAEELCEIRLANSAKGAGYALSGAGEALSAKLDVAKAQLRADHDRDELRLPWRARPAGNGRHWVVERDRPEFDVPTWCMSERAAKIIAAGHELLEAVQAAERLLKDGVAGLALSRKALAYDVTLEAIARALRKVETGVPEDA